eukprot:1414433-Pyramimonas_sp.AAC.1
MHQCCVVRDEEPIDRLCPRSRSGRSKCVRHVVQMIQMCDAVYTVKMPHAQLNCNRAPSSATRKEAVELTWPANP